MNSAVCYYCMTPTMQDGRCTHCGRQRGVRKPDSMALPLGTKLDGNSITLGEVLGEGGFGITYAGYDERKSRSVCIKEFMPRRMVVQQRDNNSVVVFGGMEEYYAHALRSFVREAKILNELHAHPNIIRAYFYFEENNTAYYGMELLHGQTLKQLLRQRGEPLSAYEMCYILNPIMDALSFSHAHNVLHRDISPNNIFLCDTPRRQDIKQPKLIDFGAAYAAISHFTQTYELVQTSGYTPIEQLLYGKDAQGPWVDIYALSATIYYCLTLNQPAPSQLIHRGDAKPIPYPSELGIRLPERVEKLLMAGLEMRYEERIKRVPNMEYFQSEMCRACGIEPFRYSSNSSTIPDTILSDSKEQTPPCGSLKCIEGKYKGRSWPLRGKTTIGRNSQKADIVLDDIMISRIHCVIEQYRDGYAITDLGSANGTYINQRRIPAHQPFWLKIGMNVGLGELAFELSYDD